MAQVVKVTEGTSYINLELPDGCTYHQRDSKGNVWLKLSGGKPFFAFKLPFDREQQEFKIAVTDFLIKCLDGSGKAELRPGRLYPLPTGCRIVIRLDLTSGISIHLE